VPGREAGVTQVDLLRHGEPVGGRRYRGQTDDPLSETGWRQMRAAVAGRDDWEVIVTSPLARCAGFARALGSERGLAVHVDERLKEIGFGAWEGRTPGEIEREDPQAIARFQQDPVAHRPPGAETLESFRIRVAAAWDGLLAGHGGRRVLLVGHAGIIRMVMSLVLEIPAERMFRIAVDNAALTRIRLDAAARPRLLFHGLRP
jgi:alpha-ribazole phosphatase/probable phosphoglycerate mutase